MRKLLFTFNLRTSEKMDASIYCSLANKLFICMLRSAKSWRSQLRINVEKHAVLRPKRKPRQINTNLAQLITSQGSTVCQEFNQCHKETRPHRKTKIDADQMSALWIACLFGSSFRPNGSTNLNAKYHEQTVSRSLNASCISVNTKLSFALKTRFSSGTEIPIVTW